MFSRRFVLDKLKLAASRAAIGTPNADSDRSFSAVVAQALDPPRQADLRPAGSVNVIDFGADPSGKRDSSEAITKAITQCFSGPDPRRPTPLLFPPGTFLIREDNLFRPPAMTSSATSWLVQGSGRRTTTLLFQPVRRGEPSDLFLYAGASPDEPNRTLIGLTWADMLVKLDCSFVDTTAQVNCFRQYGSHLSLDPEQNWTFRNCGFEGDFTHPERNGSILKIDGDSNGSENAFVLCRALAFKHVIDCTNPQAVNHLSLHCHWEAILGDMFRFIRGGNIAVYGGSLILDNFGAIEEWHSHSRYPPGGTFYADGRRFETKDGGTSGTQPPASDLPQHPDGGLDWRLADDESMYVLRVGGDLSGQINSFLISGARIELRTNRAKLVAGGDLNTGALITFDAVAVQPVLGGFRHTIEIAESSMLIRFQNCKMARAAGIWDEPFAVRFAPGPDADYPNRAKGGAFVVLEGCQVSETIHTLSTWGENSMGTIAVRDCQIAYRAAANASSQAATTIVDGTVSAPSPLFLRRPTDRPRYAKELFIPFRHWPYKTLHDGTMNDDVLVTIPPHAVIKRMVFTKRTRHGAAAQSKYGVQVLDLGRGTTVFASEMVDVSQPYEIVTPTLNLYSIAAPLTLAIRGLGTVAKEIPAEADDFILLEWS